MRLRDADLRLAALTNSVGDVARQQLESSGLADCFEQILSADEVRRLKPAPRALSLGRRAFLDRHRGTSISWRPRMGRGGCAGGGLPGSLRGAPGDGPQPDQPAARRDRRRLDRGRRQDPRLTAKPGERDQCLCSWPPSRRVWAGVKFADGRGAGASLDRSRSCSRRPHAGQVGWSSSLRTSSLKRWSQRLQR